MQLATTGHPNSLVNHRISNSGSRHRQPSPSRCPIQPSLATLGLCPIHPAFLNLSVSRTCLNYFSLADPDDPCPASSTPSEPGSPMSTLAPPTPPVAHVVCNVPLRAPKPLPYRPPAFLNSFELPDPDADLSRPPYTCAAGSKRKRSDEALQNEPTDMDDRSRGYSGKRRATERAVRGRLPTATLNGVFSARRFSC